MGWRGTCATGSACGPTRPRRARACSGPSDAFLLPPFPGVGYISVDTDVYERFKTALVTTPYDDGRAARDGALVEAFELAARNGHTPLAPQREDLGATELDMLVERLRETPRRRASGPPGVARSAPCPTAAV